MPPMKEINLVHSESEILDLEDTLRYTKEHFDNVESLLRGYHYAHKIAQELLDKRGGGKYYELDSAAKQELMKEAVRIRENRVKQEAPALKEKYAKEIQELKSKLQTFKEQNKEATYSKDLVEILFSHPSIGESMDKALRVMGFSDLWGDELWCGSSRTDSRGCSHNPTWWSYS